MIRYKFSNYETRIRLQQEMIAEIKSLNNLLGVSHVEFMTRQFTEVIIKQRTLFVKNSRRRREIIRDAILSSGLVPDHRLEYLKKDVVVTERLSKWLDTGDT